MEEPLAAVMKSAKGKTKGSEGGTNSAATAATECVPCWEDGAGEERRDEEVEALRAEVERVKGELAETQVRLVAAEAREAACRKAKADLEV